MGDSGVSGICGGGRAETEKNRNIHEIVMRRVGWKIAILPVTRRLKGGVVIRKLLQTESQRIIIYLSDSSIKDA